MLFLSPPQEYDHQTLAVFIKYFSVAVEGGQGNCLFDHNSGFQSHMACTSTSNRLCHACRIERLLNSPCNTPRFDCIKMHLLARALTKTTSETNKPNNANVRPNLVLDQPSGTWPIYKVQTCLPIYLVIYCDFGVLWRIHTSTQL